MIAELVLRREIIYATDEVKYNRKRLREYMDRGIGVETFATMLVIALRKKGLKLDN